MTNTQPPPAHTFLVIDDDQDTRQALALTLEGLGHQVTTAGSAMDALAMLKGRSFDMAFIDIMMPEMNGYDLLHQIRSTVQHSAMPVSLVTALDTHAEVLHGYQTGADYYITKPFDTKQIRYAIGILLDGEEGYSDQ